MPLWMLLFTACESDDPTETPRSGALTLLTYNVHGLPDALADTERPGAERMALISPLLDRYDIVALQEDFDPVNHEILLEASTHLHAAWFEDLASPERVYGAGLSSLARAEVVEVFEEHYTACNGVLDGSSDCLASKGFLVVRLSLGGAELDFYNTHHEAGSGPEDDAARSDQVDQILASFEGRSQGRAVILGGDTNLRPSDPPDQPLLERYAAAGLRDTCTEIGCPEGDHIDRFFFRSSPALTLTVDAWSRDASFVDDQGVDLSDHPAITSTIFWELP